jgi:hypothetical protein
MCELSIRRNELGRSFSGSDRTFLHRAGGGWLPAVARKFKQGNGSTTNKRFESLSLRSAWTMAGTQ